MEDLIYRIFNRQIIINIEGDTFSILSPSIKLRYQAELYKKSLIKTHKYDLPHLDWYEDFLIKNKFIDYNFKDKIKTISESIKKLKVDLYKAGPLIESEKKIRKNLKIMKNNFSKYCANLDFYRKPTLEYFADNLKNQFILINTTYKDDGLVFDPYKLDINLLGSIISAVNDSDISASEFREIARSDLWRNYWLSNKYNIFGIPAIEYSEDQKILCMFSRMYDNAYENPECPSEDVLNDDDKFDGWLIFQQEKRKEEKKSQKYSHIDDQYSEIFVNATSQDEANKIYEENTNESINIMKERSKVLKSKEIVKDIEFRDRQLEIMQNPIQFPTQKNIGG